MSKFCVNCGARLEDEAVFCTSCGAQQPSAQQDNAQQGFGGQNPQGGMNMDNFTAAASNMAQSAGQAVKNTFDGVTFDSVKNSMSMDNIKNVGKTKNKNTIIGLAAVAVVVIILIALIFGVFVTPGYEKPIDTYCKAIEKGDGELYAKAMPEYLNDFNEEYMSDKYDSVSEYYEDETLEMMTDLLEDEYGDNIKISYKIMKKKDLKKKDLSDAEERIEDTYDEEVDISKGYKLKVKMKIKGSDDKDDDNTWMYVYKIDGKWCTSGV